MPEIAGQNSKVQGCASSRLEAQPRVSKRNQGHPQQPRRAQTLGCASSRLDDAQP